MTVTINKASIAAVRQAYKNGELFRQVWSGQSATYGGSYPCAIGVMLPGYFEHQAGGIAIGS